MSSRLISIPYHEGRICYITGKGPVYKITVECYETQTAFQFEWKHLPTIGEWVKFRGTSRINIKTRRRIETQETKKYYHEPHDNSSMNNWHFYEMQKVKVCIVPPPEISGPLKSIVNLSRRHLDSWESNCKSKEIEAAIAALDAASKALHRALKRQEVIELDIKVSAISLTI